MKTELTIQKVGTNAERVGKRGQRFNFEGLTPHVFMLPAAAFLGVVPGFPIVYGFVISFQKYNLATLISRNAEFVRFQNYQAVLGNPAFEVALMHSPIFTFLSLVFQLAIGLGLAILFNKAFPLHHLLLSVWPILGVFFHHLRHL